MAAALPTNGTITTEGNSTESKGTITPPVLTTEQHWARKAFSDDFNTRNYDKVKEFKSADAMGESYLQMFNKMSTTGRLPAQDAPKEEWDSFYKNWGRPESGDKYILPEKYKGNPDLGAPEFVGAIGAMAHSLGLNQKQYDQLLDWGMNQSAAIQQQNTQKKEEGLSNLKKEWGLAYQSNVGTAKQALTTLVDGNKDHYFVKWLDETGLSDDPNFIKFFKEIGDQLGEDNLINGTGSSSTTDKENAVAKMAEMRMNKESPYNVRTHPMHKQTVAEMLELTKIANGL